MGASSAAEVTGASLGLFVAQAVATGANAVGLASNAARLADDIKSQTTGQHFFSKDTRDDLSNIATVAGTIAGVAGMGAAAAESGVNAAKAAASTAANGGNATSAATVVTQDSAGAGAGVANQVNAPGLGAPDAALNAGGPGAGGGVPDVAGPAGPPNAENVVQVGAAQPGGPPAAQPLVPAPGVEPVVPPDPLGAPAPQQGAAQPQVEGNGAAAGPPAQGQPKALSAANAVEGLVDEVVNEDQGNRSAVDGVRARASSLAAQTPRNLLGDSQAGQLMRSSSLRRLDPGALLTFNN